MSNGEGRLGTASKIFSIVAVLVSAGSMTFTSCNYYTQKRVADRVWRSQLITLIYETQECPERVAANAKHSLPCEPRPRANSRSRAEAVQAYVALQGEYGQKIDLSKTLLSEMIFIDDEHMDFTEADFSGSTMQAVTFKGGGSKEGSSKAGLGKAKFEDADLAGAYMANADLSGANLISTNLQGADLRGATLVGADLSKAILGDCKNFDAATHEDHGSAKLAGAKLGNALLGGANLCGVDLSGMDLHEVQNLSPDQIEKTYGDRETKLPTYISSRPDHWER